MAELVNSRVLDESKIEDDDMVDIVFKLTNFAEETNSTTRKPQNSQQPSVRPSMSTKNQELTTGQKRQLSLDQNDPSNQSDFVRTREVSNQAVQLSHQSNSSQTQKTVQISTTKTVTVHKEAYSNIHHDAPQSHRPPRKKKTRSKSDLGLFNFKMFKQQGSQITSDVRQAGDGTDKPEPPVSQVEGKVETVNPRKCFVHYDSLSVLADFNDASIGSSENNFANLKSGAATANIEDCVESETDGLLLQTPNFINEIYEEPVVKNCGPGSSAYYKNCPKYQVVMFEGPPVNFEGPSNRNKLLAGINLSDFTIDRRFLNFEHMDHGANYYRRFFVDHDHVNYFGISEPHGPLAISMQREKVEASADRGEANYQYRIIIRSAQCPPLRGSILEDFLPSSRGNNKVHFRDILECLAPQIKQENLKLAENKVAVVDELLKLDEITINTTYKIGLVYCKAGQKTEEEMYNNDVGSPAFEEFLETIGEKVALKGFDSFRGGLDNKSDTTGTHSLYTRYNNCQIMFHVSTLLPYTENDRQQVVRKRHIGNDIVTVIFQEPGSCPFTPAQFRSHYQHVFILVRACNPNTADTSYQIAVTRSHEVPEFGPLIPEERMKKGAAFRHFLLTKIINAENASMKAKKLASMARRTREQLLKTFCETLCTSTTLVPSQKKGGNPGKLGRSWSFKRKARFAQRLAPELVSRGALKWSVSVVEEGVEKPCIMAISPTQIVIVEIKSKTMMYMLPCKAVLGWTSSTDSLKLYYDTGEVIVMKRDTTSADDDSTSDIDDIVKRLTCTSDGCETQEIRVIKNQQGKLGFHIQFQGIVGDVTENGPAWAAGLRPSSRLLEVRGTLVAHLEHEQLISQLKGKDSISVVGLPPFPDGQPRRSISQLQSPTDVRTKASTSISTVRPSLDSPTPIHAATPSVGSENSDTIAPLVDRRTTPEATSRPESRESNNSRAMTRGSMIALNLLEQELGIDDTQNMDLDEFLESIVGKDQLKELDDEVKELEARSTCSSRPNTPSHHASQQSLNSDDQPLSPGASRHKSFVLSPTSARRVELPAEQKTDNDIGKRFALGSDNLDSRNSSTVGKRYATRSDTLDFGSTRSNRSVIGAERQNGHPRGGSRDSTHEKPDINEIFKIIDKTRLESEANNRSPTDDISEIDAVVSMIEKVLENTDSYLQEEFSTRGLASDSDNDNNTVSDAAGPRSTAAPASSSPYSSSRSRARGTAADTTPRNGTSGLDSTPRRQSPNRTITASPYSKPNSQKVENIQRKMGDYTEDMDRAIEQLDSINLQDTARRRPSVSSSSLSEEAFTASSESSEPGHHHHPKRNGVAPHSEELVPPLPPTRSRTGAVSAKSSIHYLRENQRSRANSIHVSPGPRRSKQLPSSVKKSKSSGDVFKLFGDLRRSASNKSLSGGKQKNSGSETKLNKRIAGVVRSNSRSGSKTPTGSGDKERRNSWSRPTSKTPTPETEKPIARNKKSSRDGTASSRQKAAARRLRSRSRVMAEDIKTAMIVNAARVKETAARTGGLIKSKSSGNIMRAMYKKGSEADEKVGPPPESRDISPQDVQEIPTSSSTNPTSTIIRRNVSLNNRDRPRPILKQRPLSDYSCYNDLEKVKAESSDSVSGLDRGVKRSATFSGRRRVSIDLSPPQYHPGNSISSSPTRQVGHLNLNSPSSRDTCHSCIRTQIISAEISNKSSLPGVLEGSQDTTKTVEEFTPETDEGVSSKDVSEIESPSTEDSSPDSAELARRIPDHPVIGARKSKSLGDMLSLTKGSPQVTSDSVNINTESEQSTSDEEFPQRHFTMRRMRREGLLMEPPSDTSDQSRASDDIPPSPLQMLMERAREAQLDQTAENDNSWVRTTLLRIAELEAALERSNFELQALRKQNREMEQTLEIVDEENAKIRREMDRTNSQLATFTTWVQSRQLL